MRTLQVIAALLHYPSEALCSHSGELHTVLTDEAVLDAAERTNCRRFIEWLTDQDLIDVQARYVETFDRSRARSLYLFEHVYGESRDRGQAMVELSRLYRSHDYAISVRELPDYLPLYLEFLSRIAVDEALPRLIEIAPLVQHLHAQLAKHDSPYAPLLQPLLRLSGVADDDAELWRQVAAEAPDDTPAALDAVWMEAPVTFGARDAAECGGGQPTAQQPIEGLKRDHTDKPV